MFAAGRQSRPIRYLFPLRDNFPECFQILCHLLYQPGGDGQQTGAGLHGPTETDGRKYTLVVCII